MDITLYLQHKNESFPPKEREKMHWIDCFLAPCNICFLDRAAFSGVNDQCLRISGGRERCRTLRNLGTGDEAARNFSNLSVKTA